ncbi:unnamed protein product [Angiostrongylus costaricensis]|uniref:Small basic protein n=1 Tax=Angiostrongylus costaricensis TaxID=334426 RepID=A0A0R3Q1V7_ANGCS|nr:unnamed protein product [Angiostrongylus costaricensis]
MPSILIPTLFFFPSSGHTVDALGYIRIDHLAMSRLAPSRIIHAGRGIGNLTPYGKRMDRLSRRIFGEVVRATDNKSMKVIRIMAAEPYETKEQLSVQDELKIIRGKVVRPPIGEGKRALLRGSKK